MPPIYRTIVYHRGDEEEIKFNFPGDVSAHSLKFVVKKDRELTSSRLVEIDSSNTSKFNLTYDSSKGVTKIIITPAPEDTQDLTDDYVYDIYDYTALKTLIDGVLYIQADVQTPFDGMALPGSAERFFAKLTTNSDKISRDDLTALLVAKGSPAGCIEFFDKVNHSPYTYDGNGDWI